ncbi:co-chaperone DjlA [Halofilum ochraceum]|uniref:co-chaperone DjlA n=1 Tax=Halofilum ochraceum TaxID=1611323 RepID=UPI0008DA2B11|nr:co-chaperone DjlA [Halofilum ochraceum]
MSWWGKLVGGAFGLMVGGPLGAVLGAALGHSFDRGLNGIESPLGGAGSQERAQAAFFTTTFSCMGHLAKVDGKVSPSEIQLAEAVIQKMQLTPDQREAAIRLFNQGKQSDFDLDGTLRQFRDECRRRTNVIQMFIEIQLQAAYADGDLDQAEEQLLLHMCSILGIPEQRFRLLERMLRGGQRSQQRAGGPPRQEGMSLADAYEILGVSKDASDDEVKKAYRRLMSQHHPDKLVSKGLPDEMVEMAKSKSQDISLAYERIREARGH